MPSIDLKREIIQRAIQQNDVILSDFAFEIGYARPYLSAVINGSRKANESILDYIAEELGISFDTLFYSHNQYKNIWQECLQAMAAWDKEKVSFLSKKLSSLVQSQPHLTLVDPQIDHHIILLKTFINKTDTKILEKMNGWSEELLLAWTLHHYRSQDFLLFGERIDQWRKFGVSEKYEGLYHLLKGMAEYYQENFLIAYDEILKSQSLFLEDSLFYFLKLSSLTKANILSLTDHYDKAKIIYQQLLQQSMAREHQVVIIQSFFLSSLINESYNDAQYLFHRYREVLIDLSYFITKQAEDVPNSDQVLKKLVQVTHENKTYEPFEQGHIDISCPLKNNLFRKELIQHYQKKRKYKAITFLKK